MSTKYTLDANVFITAWYVTYPPRIFGTLWGKLSGCIENIELIKPVYEEIDKVQAQHKKLTPEKKRELYPLRYWMEECAFDVVAINGDTEAMSINLEREYEISEVSKGAGQNDITLIAYAKLKEITLVTLEAEQKQIPCKKCNYRIPLICSEQSVKCIDFIKFLDELKVRM